MMTIGAALVLIAAGAILRFAIATVTTHGVDLHTIGDILMIVGIVGVILWMFVWAPWVRRSRGPSAPPPDVDRHMHEDAHRDSYGDQYGTAEQDPYHPSGRGYRR